MGQRVSVFLETGTSGSYAYAEQLEEGAAAMAVAAGDVQHMFGVLPTFPAGAGASAGDGDGRGRGERVHDYQQQQQVPTPPLKAAAGGMRMRGSEIARRLPVGEQVREENWGGEEKRTPAAAVTLEYYRGSGASVMGAASAGTWGLRRMQSVDDDAAAGDDNPAPFPPPCSSDCLRSEHDRCENWPDCVVGGLGCNAQNDLLCRFCGTAPYVDCVEDPSVTKSPTPSPTENPDRVACSSDCLEPGTAFPCYDDPTCLDGDNLVGCNALEDTYCRYCGFNDYLPCLTTPAPSPGIYIYMCVTTAVSIYEKVCDIPVLRRRRGKQH